MHKFSFFTFSVTNRLIFAEGASEAVSARPKGERFGNRYESEFYWKKNTERHDEFMEKTPIITELDRAKSTNSFANEYVYKQFQPDLITDMRAIGAAEFTFEDNRQGCFANFKMDYYKERASKMPYFTGFEIDEAPFQALFEKYSTIPIKTAYIKQLVNEITELYISEIKKAVERWQAVRDMGKEKSKDKNVRIDESGYKQGKDKNTYENRGYLENAGLSSTQLAVCGGNTIRVNLDEKGKIKNAETVFILGFRELQNKSITQESRATGELPQIRTHYIEKYGKYHPKIKQVLDSFIGKPFNSETALKLDQKLAETARDLINTLSPIDKMEWETRGLAQRCKYFTFHKADLNGGEIMLTETARKRLKLTRIGAGKESIPNLILKRNSLGYFTGYEAKNIPWLVNNTAFDKYINRHKGFPNQLDEILADEIAERINKVRPAEV
jgi:hypothetical protein